MTAWGAALIVGLVILSVVGGAVAQRFGRQDVGLFLARASAAAIVGAAMLMALRAIWAVFGP